MAKKDIITPILEIECVEGCHYLYIRSGMRRRSISLPLYWIYNVAKEDIITSILEIECGEEGCHYLYIRSGMR